jgi:hypothetical protein
MSYVMVFFVLNNLRREVVILLSHGESTRYNIKLVSDLQQVGGFLRFPPPITEILLKMV